MYFRMKFGLFFRFFDSWYTIKYLLTETSGKHYAFVSLGLSINYFIDITQCCNSLNFLKRSVKAKVMNYDSYLSHSLKSLGFTLFFELEFVGSETWSNKNKSCIRVDES